MSACNYRYGSLSRLPEMLEQPGLHVTIARALRRRNRGNVLEDTV
jgi:hypothetical protein